MSLQAELLRWYYRLGHMSFTKLRILTARNIIPKTLLQVKVSKCGGCLVGDMHRRLWRTKNKNKRKIGQTNKPG